MKYEWNAILVGLHLLSCDKNIPQTFLQINVRILKDIVHFIFEDMIVEGWSTLQTDLYLQEVFATVRLKAMSEERLIKAR